VAQGAPLLVLGANAGDAGIWSRSMGLHLAPQPADKTIGARLPMASGGLNPAQARAGEWQGEEGVWTRDWHQGRIAWLGVGGWHRHAIEEPRALALWWQDVLDRLRVRRKIDAAWLDPRELPLPHRRLDVCARGDALAKGGEVRLPRTGADAALAAPCRNRRCILRRRVAEAVRLAGHPCASAGRACGRQCNLCVCGRRLDAVAACPAPRRYRALRGPHAGAGRRRWRTHTAGLAVRVVFALAMLGLWWRERR
jgi:hypothetical protein